MEANIYNLEGKKSGTISLPKEIFGVRFKADLVHQVVTSMLSNKRAGTAHTKFRGEVSGTGKKPWKQKGTGRARHGSRRSPIWVGGGIAHGPRSEKDYTKNLSRKMKEGALFSVLSKKMTDGEILFVDEIKFSEPKTIQAKQALKQLATIDGFDGLATRRKNAFMLALPKKDNAVVKSFSNFSNGLVEEIRNMNPVDLLNYKYLVLVDPAEVVSFLSQKKLLRNKTAK